MVNANETCPAEFVDQVENYAGTSTPIEMRCEEDLDEHLVEICVPQEMGEECEQVRFTKRPDPDIWNFKNNLFLPQRLLLIEETQNPGILLSGAQDSNPIVRAKVAQLSTNENLLADLSQDEMATVRRSVAQNTRNPVILSPLAEDPEPIVRMAVAQNSSDPQILEQLVDDELSNVRYLVLRKTTDPNIVQMLTNDNDRTIRKKAKQKLSILQQSG